MRRIATLLMGLVLTIGSLVSCSTSAISDGKVVNVSNISPYVTVVLHGNGIIVQPSERTDPNIFQRIFRITPKQQQAVMVELNNGDVTATFPNETTRKPDRGPVLNVVASIISIIPFLGGL